jgi:hypothetical protein
MQPGTWGSTVELLAATEEGRVKIIVLIPGSHSILLGQDGPNRTQRWLRLKDKRYQWLRADSLSHNNLNHHDVIQDITPDLRYLAHAPCSQPVVHARGGGKSRGSRASSSRASSAHDSISSFSSSSNARIVLAVEVLSRRYIAPRISSPTGGLHAGLDAIASAPIGATWCTCSFFS